MIPTVLILAVIVVVGVIIGRLLNWQLYSLGGKGFLAAKTYSRVALPSRWPEASLKPSPTATPAPTSQPLVGYCLRAPIIFYHHIEPMALAREEHHAALTLDSQYFERHMAYLVSAGYTTISVDQLAHALLSHQKLPAKTVAVTIDDGYQDAYTFAYPIAQRYHIILNLMIPTGLVGNPGFLTWGELREMVNSGLVFAYDHTWSHSALGMASRAKDESEILTARDQLVQELGRSVDIFAYPYGSKSNMVVDILKNNGFAAALSTIPGFYQCDSFIYSLHRNRAGALPLSSYGL